MHRRVFVLGLVATACTPTKPTDEDPPAIRSPPRVLPGTALLVIAEWSTPVPGTSEWLVVYEDGLAEMRSFEAEEKHQVPELRVRTLRMPPAELDQLRASLADPGFENARTSYREEGFVSSGIDGVALIIADMATHRRRLIIGNHPLDLPAPVATVKSALEHLAGLLKDSGYDGFARGPDRIELVYMFSRAEERRQLTVFENGLLELRTTYTTREQAYEANDHPTPDSITGQAGPGDLHALRSALSALPSTPPEVEGFGRARDTFFVGSAPTEFHVPRQPSPEMSAVVSALDDIIDTFRSY